MMLDNVRLYSNIPHADDLNALFSNNKQHISGGCGLRAQFLSRIFILTKFWFWIILSSVTRFSSKHLAPRLECHGSSLWHYVHVFETSVISSQPSGLIALHRWYFFPIWIQSEQALLDFVSFLTSVHVTIKFTFDFLPITFLLGVRVVAASS